MISGERHLAGRRILVVEDNYLIVSVWVEALQSEGVEVIGPAVSIARATQLIRTVPDIEGALLDLNLQGVMGFGVADTLLARQIPFVFTTGYGRPSIPMRYAHVPHHGKHLDLRRLPDALFGWGAHRVIGRDQAEPAASRRCTPAPTSGKPPHPDRRNAGCGR